MRLLKNVYVQQALKARQMIDAARLSLRREDVLAGLLEAVEQARTQRNPMAMISGLRELGRMMGFYAVETKRVEFNVEGQAIQCQMSAMSDAELLSLIDRGGLPC